MSEPTPARLPVQPNPWPAEIRTDLDMGDALFDAVRLHIAGRVDAAGCNAIPAIEYDAIAAAGFLANFVARAVRAYAEHLGRDPLVVFDELWQKPSRGAA